MKEKQFLQAMATAICGAWSKGYYQGIQDGASQPDQKQMKTIVEISCEVSGITLTGDGEAVVK